MQGKNSCKPDIQYPCRWHYRLIGEERTAILEAIRASMDVATCTIEEGNVSSGGRYCSLNVEVTVANEAERLRFYRLFAEHPAVRVVL